MKLKSTFLLIFCITFLGLNAQEIATFEDGSTTLGTIVGAAADQQTEFSLSADNPDQTGINSSDKCLYILTNHVASDDVTVDSPGRPTWKENVVTITFETPIAVDAANSYLHVMHMKEKILNNWIIFAESGDDAYVELGRGVVLEAGKWFDIVVDLGAKMSTVKSIRIHLDGNWSGDGVTRFYEPTKFYYDNIELSADVTPRGTAEGEYITRNNLLDFEDIDVQAATAILKTQNASYLMDSTYVNADMSGLNTTSKCMYWSSGDLAPAWWHGVDLNFVKPVSSGVNKYLHIMMKKSEAASAGTVVSLFNVGGTQTGNLMNTPLTTEWVDYVMEIPASHAIFTRLFIKFNATANVGCFADEIVINTDPAPRVPITTALEKKAVDSFVLYQNSGSVVFNSAIEQNVTIFNISGRLVHNSSTKSLSVKVPQAGVYIVRVNNEVRKIVVK